MGFNMLFCIIFGTNLLTRGPVPVSVFFLPILVFCRNGIPNGSKRNETLAMIFLGPKANQKTWSWSPELREAATRQEGAPRGVGTPPTLVGPSWLPSPTSFAYIYSYTLKTSKSTTKPYFHRRNLLYREIPSWGLFRRSARGGINHGGLLHEHHSLSDEVWVVYHRPLGPYLLSRRLLLSLWFSIQSSPRFSWRSIRCNSFCGVFVEIRWIVGLWFKIIYEKYLNIL